MVAAQIRWALTDEDVAVLEQLQELSERIPYHVPRELLLRLLKLCEHEGSSYYAAVEQGAAIHPVFAPGLRELIGLARRGPRRRSRRNHEV